MSKKAIKLIEPPGVSRRRKERKFWNGAFPPFFWGTIILWIIFAATRATSLLIGAIAASFTVLLVLSRLRSRRIEARERSNGIKALEKSGAILEPSGEAILYTKDRKLTVGEFNWTNPLGSGGAFSYDDCTRISVEHGGRIPCVIQLETEFMEYAKFFDKGAYEEWVGGKVWNLIESGKFIPKEVKIHGRKVATALPKNNIPQAKAWTNRILDDPNIAALKGYIIIEPTQILWWRKGHLLHHELLENAAQILATIAEKIEKEH